MSKEKSKDIKEEAKKELVDKIANIEDLSNIEQMVKDNKIVFEVDGTTYKVTKLEFAKQTQLDKFRRKEYIKLMNDDDMLFRKQWIEKYKKKGVDIEKMERDMNLLQNDIEKLLVRLATTENKTDVNKLKTEIIEIKGKQALLNIEKTNLLCYSIEDQLMLSVNSYYAFLSLEKKEDKDKWVNPFATYEDFLNCSNDNLLNKVFYYTNHFIYQVPFL